MKRLVLLVALVVVLVVSLIAILYPQETIYEKNIKTTKCLCFGLLIDKQFPFIKINPESTKGLYCLGFANKLCKCSLKFSKADGVTKVIGVPCEGGNQSLIMGKIVNVNPIADDEYTFEIDQALCNIKGTLYDCEIIKRSINAEVIEEPPKPNKYYSMMFLLFEDKAILKSFTEDEQWFREKLGETGIWSEPKLNWSEWYKRENATVNFDQPYVKWLIDGKGNGTFTLSISIEYNTGEEYVKEQLSKYGIIDNLYCYKNKCHIYLYINNFYLIEDIFNLPFVEDIEVGYIESDYKLNVSLEEMKKCDKDDDCVRAPAGCQGIASDSINKKYIDLWNTQIDCNGVAILAGAMFHMTYVKCIENKCTLIDDYDFDRWYTSSNSIILVKFKENTPKIEIESILKPLDKEGPEVDYRIRFPFDIYTFKLPKNETNYICNYDEIWCYIEATDDFINYLNTNHYINAFVSDYEEISLIANNERITKPTVLKLINSYNNLIKIDNISVKKGLYGFYYTEYNSWNLTNFIVNNLRNNTHVKSLNRSDVWLRWMDEAYTDCTNRTSFFPMYEWEKCKSE